MYAGVTDPAAIAAVIEKAPTFEQLFADVRKKFSGIPVVAEATYEELDNSIGHSVQAGIRADDLVAAAGILTDDADTSDEYLVSMIRRGLQTTALATGSKRLHEIAGLPSGVSATDQQATAAIIAFGLASEKPRDMSSLINGATLLFPGLFPTTTKKKTLQSIVTASCRKSLDLLRARYPGRDDIAVLIAETKLYLDSVLEEEPVASPPDWIKLLIANFRHFESAFQPPRTRRSTRHPRPSPASSSTSSLKRPRSLSPPSSSARRRTAS